MIVKDESHIIVETLKNVVEKIPITSWCISDTGFTDGTQELITEFFKSAGISGEIPRCMGKLWGQSHESVEALLQQFLM
jgi:hypothetical protein